jgi:hypothetical protein
LFKSGGVVNALINVLLSGPEAEFLDEIQTKVLRVFLLAIHSHLYGFALDFYFFKLTQPLTVSMYNAKDKGEKPDSKLYTPLKTAAHAQWNVKHLHQTFVERWRSAVILEYKCSRIAQVTFQLILCVKN